MLLHESLLRTETIDKAVLFLQDLKKATNSQHVLLESNHRLAALLQPEVNVHQYHYYLLLMNEIVKVYETCILSKMSHLLPAAGQPMASTLLKEDLKSLLGIDWSCREIHNYPSPPAPMTICFALGFVYVMEGSKLGGKVIFKHIERHLNIPADKGAKYLTDDGAPTMQRWKTLLTVFSHHVVKADGQAEAIAGASYAFRSINDFFSAQHDHL